MAELEPNTADSKKNEAPAASATQPADDDDFTYPTGPKLALLLGSVFIGMFLVALDKLIITAAIPQITTDFASTSDIGWYGTAYLLTNCAFLLVFGKAYTLFNVKTTFLAAVALVEVGSAVCGAAPSSVAFIVGRAIAGLGAGGIQSGVIVIVVYAVPLEKRPQYQGLLGAVYGVASVTGPLIGGAFTSSAATWRWCFYLNLPLGGLVMAIIFFLLNVPSPAGVTASWREKLVQLNAEGFVALLPGVVCLCLALQWGGFTYSWNDSRIIALLVVGLVLLIAFVLIQIWRKERATVPPRIFAQRSIFSAFFVSCCTGAHQTLIFYFLPVWFQAIKGDSAVDSGIHLLPSVLPLVVASIIVGVVTTKTGYYTPPLLVGICLTAVGLGLLTTLRVDATMGQWIGYQVLYGLGFGASLQAPNLAAQTVLHRDEVSIGASLMLFGQTLFGAVFASVGQNVLDGQLASRLAGITSVTPLQIEQAGAVGILQLVPPQLRGAALEAYNGSIVLTIQVALIVACISIFGGLGMEWRSTKAEKKDAGVKDVEEAREKNGAE